MLEFIFKYGTQPIIILLLLILLFLIQRIRRRVKLNEIKLGGMDFALEKSLNNGYAKHRNEFIEKKLSDDKFINSKLL